MQNIQVIADELISRIQQQVDGMNLTECIEIKRRAELDEDIGVFPATFVSVYTKYPISKIWGCEINQFTRMIDIEWLSDDCFKALRVFDAWLYFEPDEIYKQAVAIYEPDEIYEVIEILLQVIGFEDSDEIRRAATAIDRMISDLPRGEQIRRLEHMAYLYDTKLFY